MRKQAVSNAADSPMQWLEQIAHLAQSARNSALLVERVLQLLGDALEAIAGAVVLAGEAGKRPQEWCWGTYQQQIVQVGRELVQGLEARSAATAKPPLEAPAASPQPSAGGWLITPDSRSRAPSVQRTTG